MLIKLLKYEIRASYVRFVGVFASFILLSAAAALYFRHEPQALGGVIATGITALCVITLVTLFQRYRANLYGPEGYLMFSLPVGSKKLLCSKLLAALFWSGTLACVFLLAYFVVSYIQGARVIQLPGNIKWDEITLAKLVSVGLALLSVGVFILLDLYFSISASMLPLWKKFAVPAGFIIYFVVQSMALLPYVILRRVLPSIFPFCNDILQQIRNNGVASMVADNSETLIYTGFCILLFFATSYLLEHKTNLK